MNILELLEKQAKTLPENVAIIETNGNVDKEITYSQLNEAVKRASTILLDSEIKAGDTVLFFSTMTIDLYVALLAVLRVGAICMFLDPSAGKKHIEQCCEIRPPKALIAIPKAHLLTIFNSGLRRIPVKLSLGGYFPFRVNLSKWESADVHKNSHDSPPDYPALITFTSGSTGRPKAALRTHKFLVSQHKVLERTLGLNIELTDLTTLPVFLLANLGSGVTSIIPDCDLRRPGFIDAGPVLDQIDRLKPHTSVASPAFFERLCSESVKENRPMESFRRIYTGGAPVFMSLMDLMKKSAPNAEIVAVYGSTEAEPISEIELGEISETDRTKMMSGSGLLAGVPVEEIDVRILKDRWGKKAGPFTETEFASECQGIGNYGEIVVHGEHVLKGYLDGVGDEETKFDVGNERWHRTGDSGYFDESGRLWLLGRSSAKIGERENEIYPFAVEVAAINVENVRRTALIEHNTNRILVVEPEEKGKSLDVEKIRHDLEWAKLDGFRVVEKIPMDKRHNAKVDYPALKKYLDRLR
ncbi:MAG TPA: AMP-binding protein [bacterium]|jgi:acyl-CoA synthetase (AMP-forming)/AMP-acid ligase II